MFAFLLGGSITLSGHLPKHAYGRLGAANKCRERSSRYDDGRSLQILKLSFSLPEASQRNSLPSRGQSIGQFLPKGADQVFYLMVVKRKI